MQHCVVPPTYLIDALVTLFTIGRFGPLFQAIIIASQVDC